MRYVNRDPELAVAADRYVRPGSRYLQLLSWDFRYAGELQRSEFLASLIADARRATER